MTEMDDWIYTNETQAPGQPLPPKPDGDDKKSGKDEKSGNDEKKG